MPLKPLQALEGARLYNHLIRQAGGDLVDMTSLRPGMELQVGLYQSLPYDLKIPSMAVARLSINLRNVAVSGTLDDGPVRDYRGQRYSLFLTPAEATAHWCKRQRSRHINIYFGSQVADEADGRSLRFSEQPLLDACCPQIRRCVDALEWSLDWGDPIAEDASIGLARLILAILAHRRGTPAPQLSAKSLETVRDYVSANLDGAIRVGDLAAVLGMAPTRFALAFTSTTGRPPHRFVMECRLAAAMEMLRHGRAPLAEVAAGCGFSSQQHLTSAMHRLLGTTPGKVRHGGR